MFGSFLGHSQRHVVLLQTEAHMTARFGQQLQFMQHQIKHSGSAGGGYILVSTGGGARRSALGGSTATKQKDNSINIQLKDLVPLLEGSAPPPSGWTASEVDRRQEEQGGDPLM